MADKSQAANSNKQPKKDRANECNCVLPETIKHMSVNKVEVGSGEHGWIELSSGAKSDHVENPPEKDNEDKHPCIPYFVAHISSNEDDETTKFVHREDPRDYEWLFSLCDTLYAMIP